MRERWTQDFHLLWLHVSLQFPSLQNQDRPCCCYLQLSLVKVRFSCWTHSWCFHSLLLSPSWLFSFPPLNNMLKFSGWSWWRDGLNSVLLLLWFWWNWSLPFVLAMKTTCKLLFSFLKWSFSFSLKRRNWNPLLLLQFKSTQPRLLLQINDMTKKSKVKRFDLLFFPPLSLILSKLSLLTVLAQTIRPCIQILQLMSHENILFIPFHILLRSSS